MATLHAITVSSQSNLQPLVGGANAQGKGMIHMCLGIVSACRCMVVQPRSLPWPYAGVMVSVFLPSLILLCPGHVLVTDHPECNCQPHGTGAQGDQVG